MKDARNKSGPNTMPWGNSEPNERESRRSRKRRSIDCILTAGVLDVTNPGIKVALNATGRELDKQNRMPDCVKCL